VLPDAATPTWTHEIQVPSLPGTNTLHDGMLTISTLDNGGNGDSWRIYGSTDGPWDMTAGAGNQTSCTIEFRVRMGEKRAAQDNIMDFYFYDGLRRTSLSFRDTAVVDSDQPSRWTSSEVDTRQWHTYRFTMDYSEPVAVKTLYLDDDPTPILVITSDYEYSTTATYIGFGDINGVSAGVMDVEYVRWTNEGVFPPVPEPTSMALLGLGGLSCVLFRRPNRLKH
jgi:hypothetical protein